MAVSQYEINAVINSLEDRVVQIKEGEFKEVAGAVGFVTDVIYRSIENTWIIELNLKPYEDHNKKILPAHVDLNVPYRLHLLWKEEGTQAFKNIFKFLSREDVKKLERGEDECLKTMHQMLAETLTRMQSAEKVGEQEAGKLMDKAAIELVLPLVSVTYAMLNMFGDKNLAKIVAKTAHMWIQEFIAAGFSREEAFQLISKGTQYFEQKKG